MPGGALCARVLTSHQATPSATACLPVHSQQSALVDSTFGRAPLGAIAARGRGRGRGRGAARARPYVSRSSSMRTTAVFVAPVRARVPLARRAAGQDATRNLLAHTCPAAAVLTARSAPSGRALAAPTSHLALSPSVRTGSAAGALARPRCAGRHGRMPPQRPSRDCRMWTFVCTHASARCCAQHLRRYTAGARDLEISPCVRLLCSRGHRVAVQQTLSVKTAGAAVAAPGA